MTKPVTNRERVEAQERDDHLHEALTDAERHTILSALVLAARAYADDKKVFEDVAKELRAGKTVALFASGEGGAKAADHLAAQFQSQYDDAMALIERFE